VNITFHRYESEVYDTIHSCMWASLPRHFNYLSSDILKAVTVPANLRLLDVGCGTGLGSELLLHTEFGKRVGHVDLLDTSSEMLDRASRRSRNWPVSAEMHHGDITSIETERFDVVLACSVLHHIPDLHSFLAQVSALLREGGVFLHLQDPNGDHVGESAFVARQGILRRHEGRVPPMWYQRVLARMRRLSRRKTYIDKINEELLTSETIENAMTDDEMWLVTDIHAGAGKGVSAGMLTASLPELTRLSIRTYSFFGKMYSQLPYKLREVELALSEANDLTGYHLAAAWQKGGLISPLR
jgi:SAM-dependent methyltransferase